MSIKKIFIGIDNGISGTIGVISEKEILFFKPPTKSEQNYTKKKGNVTRIIIMDLYNQLKEIIKDYKTEEIICKIERPMINPTRWKASMSAIRAWETTINVMEMLKIPYGVIDSKEWQKTQLPMGTKGEPELKKASRQMGEKLFPQFKTFKHPDMDGILIAEHLRQTWQQ